MPSWRRYKVETEVVQGQAPPVEEGSPLPERAGSAVERGRVRAAPLLPYVLASGAAAIGGELLYGMNETLGLGLFVLGIVPLAVTALVLALSRPWVSVSRERIAWRYLWGKEEAPWAAVLRVARVSHPAGGFRLFVDVDPAGFKESRLGKLRRRLSGPAQTEGSLRCWVPVGKLMRGLQVRTLKNLPAALRRANPTMQAPERGLGGPWGRYRVTSFLIFLTLVLVVIILGFTR